MSKHKAEIELLCQNLEEYTGSRLNIFDTGEAVEALKALFDQNEKVKKDLQKIVHNTIQNFYEMSLKLNQEDSIDQKLDLTILQDSYYEIDLKKSSKSYITKYNELLQEAKLHFVQDLDTLKLELNQARQLLL